MLAQPTEGSAFLKVVGVSGKNYWFDCESGLIKKEIGVDVGQMLPLSDPVSWAIKRFDP